MASGVHVDVRFELQGSRNRGRAEDGKFEPGKAREKFGASVGGRCYDQLERLSLERRGECSSWPGSTRRAFSGLLRCPGGGRRE